MTSSPSSRPPRTTDVAVIGSGIVGLCTAHQLLARGLELAPDDPRLHRQLGKLLAIDGDFPGSRRELERAVALDPTNDALRFDLLAILRRTGDEAAFEHHVHEGLGGGRQHGRPG